METLLKNMPVVNRALKFLALDINLLCIVSWADLMTNPVVQPRHFLSISLSLSPFSHVFSFCDPTLSKFYYLGLS